MKAFRLYRLNPPESYRSGGYANAPEEAQLEGVIFADGTVSIRWLTDLRSHSLWDSYEVFEKVHGHPEYQSRTEWLEVLETLPNGDGLEGQKDTLS